MNVVADVVVFAQGPLGASGPPGFPGAPGPKVSIPMTVIDLIISKSKGDNAYIHTQSAGHRLLFSVSKLGLPSSMSVYLLVGKIAKNMDYRGVSKARVRKHCSSLMDLGEQLLHTL